MKSWELKDYAIIYTRKTANKRNMRQWSVLMYNEVSNSLKLSWLDVARFIDRKRHALYPNFIIIGIGLFVLHRLKSCCESLHRWCFCVFLPLDGRFNNNRRRLETFFWVTFFVAWFWHNVYVLFQTSTNAVKLIPWKWTTAIRMPLALIIRANTTVLVILNISGMV